MRVIVNTGSKMPLDAFRYFQDRLRCKHAEIYKNLGKIKDLKGFFEDLGGFMEVKMRPKTFQDGAKTGQDGARTFARL